MATSRLVALALSFLSALAVSSAARADITGTYNLTVQTTMTAPNCTWVGQGTMVQNGTALNGNALLQLDVSGNPDPLCVAVFPTLSGPLTGTVIAGAIDLTGTLGPFTAHFVGTTTDNGLSATGTWTAPIGNLRARGTFAAERVFAQAPMVSGSVLGALVLSLLAVGAWSMRRLSRPAHRL